MTTMWRTTIAVLTITMLSVSVMAQEQEIPEQSNTEIMDQMRGDSITLSVEGVEISALLKLLSQARRVNIVAGSEVQGPVSVNLFEVPFEAALDAILGVGGYTHFKRGDIIIVTSETRRNELPMGVNGMKVKGFQMRHADPQDVASVVESFLSPAGRLSVSQGNNIIVQDSPEYLELIENLMRELDVPPNDSQVFVIDHLPADEVLVAIAPFLSKSGQAIVTSNDRVVVQDGTEYLRSIEQLILEIDVPPLQVMISGKILTVSQRDETSFGVDISRVVLDSVGAINDAGFTQGFVPNFTASTTGGLSGFFAQLSSGNEELFIQALEDRGDVELLASPQVTIIDGEQARIQVGDRLGFRQTTTTQTSSLESVEFLDVGTVLEVTPYISSNGLIKMEVHPEVSTGEIGLDGVPSQRTTDVSTTMLVEDGGTVVIGGLLDARKERSRSQVPILGDIPIIGLMFGRNTWVDRKLELIVMITPHIVGYSDSPLMRNDIARVDTASKYFEFLPEELKLENQEKLQKSIVRPDKRLRRRGVQNSE
ncbi:MAG: hypothetical protein COA73_13100 [Candidatus Hydrogenedentota bacterium]|nr:MAG: hypothetical protein COA73_13100 [Candidatus Hydrogenedentota bacterium]